MSDFDSIDTERLYTTVYELLGVRDPVTTPEALDAAGDYIKKKMQALGLSVREQIFHLPGWDRPFRNIEGTLGPVENQPAAVVMAHYDTVATTLGANDDAAGIAAMLEIARALSALANPPPVRFVAVTLEEQNPAITGPAREAACRFGVRDEKGRYRTLAMAKACTAIEGRAKELFTAGSDYGEAYLQALEEATTGASGAGETDGTDMPVPPEATALFRKLSRIHGGISPDTRVGGLNLIGSSRWLEEARERKLPLAFGIVLDEIGTFRYTEGSQKTLDGIDVYQFLGDSHRIDPEKRIADFLLVLGDAPSERLGKTFMEAVRTPGLDLPAGLSILPMCYPDILTRMPRALSSDHASFWKAGLPALFCFDSSVARNPFCHSMADGMDAVDFPKVREIARATALTLLDRSLYTPVDHGGQSEETIND